MIDKDIKEAMKHPDKFGAGAKKRKKLSPSKRFSAVMLEYERGTLYGGDGKKVTDRQKAIAIAYSESRK